VGIEEVIPDVGGPTAPAQYADTIPVCAIAGDPEYFGSAAVLQVE